MEVSYVHKFGFACVFFLIMKTSLIPELFHFASFYSPFPSLFGLGINKHLVSSFEQGINRLQSSEFSISALWLCTTKSTESKSRYLLTSGLKEPWQAWIMEWRRPSKERTTACHKEREKPACEGGIRLADLPVELEVSQNPDSISGMFVLEEDSFTWNSSVS